MVHFRSATLSCGKAQTLERRRCQPRTSCGWRCQAPPASAARGYRHAIDERPRARRRSGVDSARAALSRGRARRVRRARRDSADEGDRRWLWGAVLALLGLETVLQTRARRRVRSTHVVLQRGARCLRPSLRTLRTSPRSIATATDRARGGDRRRVFALLLLIVSAGRPAAAIAAAIAGAAVAALSSHGIGVSARRGGAR